MMTDDGHISDDDLERFILGMVKDEAELERLEQHLLVCAECIERAEQSRKYVLTMKTALARRELAGKASAGGAKVRRAKARKKGREDGPPREPHGETR
jgi:hypothetical protein